MEASRGGRASEKLMIYSNCDLNWESFQSTVIMLPQLTDSEIVKFGVISEGTWSPVGMD